MNKKTLLSRSVWVLGWFALILLSGSSGPAAHARSAARTWYVNGGCAVCGDGTLTSPFRTISRALAFADSGDAILVAQGTYVENLFISTPITLTGGYTPTLPSWTRDIARYATIVTSAHRVTPGDWDGDWLGSPSVIKDGSTYKMWYSAGNDIDGESIGYADSPDGLNWFKSLSNPLLAAGPPGAWDQAGVADPAVLAADSGFHMWYVGVNTVGAKAIGYATSPDGLTWQKHDDNPVLRPDSGDDASFGFPTVIQAGPGDYRMWYSEGGKIWRATSPDGVMWTKQSTPALTPGYGGTWDDARVYAPQVIADSGGYKMWYTAESWSSSGQRIGYASSTDGLVWTKSPGNPVLTGTTGRWDAENSGLPAVAKEGAAGYVMWYRGSSGSGQAFGQAASSSGLAWVKYSGNPVLSKSRPTAWGSAVVTLAGNSDEAVLDGLTITGGSAAEGGGLYLAGTRTTIRNCTVTGNVARSGGGGIHITTGAPLIENTIVRHNSAANGWAGGIMIGPASPIISGSLVADNSARGAGGGLVIYGALQPALIATTISSNTAPTAGGILLGSGSTFNVYASRIDGNTAARMAGLWSQDSTLAMTNTFVVDNHALVGGPGAIGLRRSSARLANVTVAGNTASDGLGGIAFDTDQPDKSLDVLNSILAFNGSHDLSCPGGACTVTFSDVQEGITGTGNISVDPRFIDRTTGNYRLQPGSPAINAGTDQGAPSTDFEGDPRPHGKVDMGADECAGGVIFLPLLLRGS